VRKILDQQKKDFTNLRGGCNEGASSQLLSRLLRRVRREACQTTGDRSRDAERDDGYDAEDLGEEMCLH
jgi:hypothetical protein